MCDELLSRWALAILLELTLRLAEVLSLKDLEPVS